jgi:transcriptional regulator with XRE-family HTH domain
MKILLKPAKRVVFANFIRLIREELDLSQAQLAQRLEMSICTISRWENEHFEPEPVTLRVLSEFVKQSGSKKINDRFDVITERG